MRLVQGKMSDKRPGIKVASLRQSLWIIPARNGRRRLVGLSGLDEKRPEETTDSIPCIDIDIMLAVPFTKSMISDKLTEALRTNKWNLGQPVESLHKKRIEQFQRAAATKDKKKGVAVPEDDEVAIDPITGDYDYE